MKHVHALRGPALTFRGDPRLDGVEHAGVYESDALILIEAGKIAAFGPFAALKARLPAGAAVERIREGLILPGFVDCHTHYPQVGMIGAHGNGLLDWLTTYTFPEEERFADLAVCRKAARLFLDECLRHGTTTAAVYGSVHEHSVDAFFAEAKRRGLCMVAGNPLLDRNGPAAMRLVLDEAVARSERLIDRWHGRGRSIYAVTPRFAPACSPRLLEACAALWRSRDGIVLQSHLSETRDEVAWARKLFPKARSYFDVYERHGLAGPGAVYGHGIHLSEAEQRRLHATGTALAHCPTSNAFLGSGIFDIGKAKAAKRPVKVGLATDIGAGTSFSMLRTMGAAYEAARLAGADLAPAEALYLATRGSAEALGLGHRIGSIAPGHDADLVVLDLASTPLIAARVARSRDIWESLFVQMILADDRAISRVYVAGALAHRRDAG
ncbi:MAG: guanine deaminase [Rhodospirillaceae bacterium]|nr:guanine deaminase [Rhodospirillaceae bacterium]